MAQNGADEKAQRSGSKSSRMLKKFLLPCSVLSSFCYNFGKVSNVLLLDEARPHTGTGINANTTKKGGVFKNSVKWLTGPRFSNANVSDDLVYDLIMGMPPLSLVNRSELILSQQSICPADSKFLHWQAGDEKEDGKIEDSLVYRLMFLAIHEHQHRPARAEAFNRLKITTDTLSNVTGKVGNFDYECDPDTKYFVNSLPNFAGFGFTFRHYGIEPIMLGLLTNRVSLNMHLKVHGHPGSPKKKLFGFSSCERGDMQCMFMPLSPCTLTQEEIDNAVALPNEELLKLRDTGILNETYAKEKVLLIISGNHGITPKGVPQAFADKITSLYDASIKQLRDAGSSSKPWNLDEVSLHKVTDRILNNTEMPWQSCLLYALRMNQSWRDKINNVIQKSIPEGFDRSSAIGLPIRDGDKCGSKNNGEMKCLKFPQYMQMAQEMALKRTKQRQNTTGRAYTGKLTNSSINMYNTIVLSSDSKSILKARFNYTKNETFPFEFIANDEDVGQGSGHPIKHLFWKITDEVMIATLASFKMQLMPETLILNMCSNSHRMLALLYRGCGRNEVGYMEFTNENDNKMLRGKCKLRGVDR
eukprot:CAMPEP_0198259390 /NCGR_PEP_ID=MMETSP1447-20131203/8609_1 /TAXON_ID=420782 /ORGANISM="Chaetoceros dichaeta, Strain CCMP1751" /LENGTH=585 /DNA_ID=CAMNT_0043946779 /DNA_START=62 /DNA_END=1819 /DNA_ORIENTATION=-